MRIDFEAISKSLKPFQEGDDDFITHPRLCDYLDYRQYLRDYYHYKKSQHKDSIRAYTYSIFSAAADIRSPNYLKLIIEGKRNLSEEMIGKFARALGLNKIEAREFYVLVMYTQATDPSERTRYLRELAHARYQQKLEKGEIDRKLWEKVPNWVTWVLYALADQKDARFSVAEIKKTIRNKCSEEEIKESLESLISEGFLVRDAATGAVQKSQQWPEMPQGIPVALIRKLQAELMYLGLESLFTDSPQDREFGSLTVTLTREEFENLKFQLRKFRKAIQKENMASRTHSKGDAVYQLNIQLFPVTEVAKLDN